MPQKRNPVARGAPPAPLLAGRRAGRGDDRGAPQHAVHRRERRRGRGPGGGLRGVRGGRAAPSGSSAGFIRAARVDEARVRQHIDESCITATELADSLVRAEGISLPPGARGGVAAGAGMLDRGERFPTVPYARVRRGVRRRSRAGLPGSARRTSAASRRPSTSSAVRTLPGGSAPGPLGASLAATGSELDVGPRVARGVPRSASRASIAGWPSARAPSAPDRRARYCGRFARTSQPPTAACPRLPSGICGRYSIVIFP